MLIFQQFYAALKDGSSAGEAVKAANKHIKSLPDHAEFEFSTFFLMGNGQLIIPSLK